MVLSLNFNCHWSCTFTHIFPGISQCQASVALHGSFSELWRKAGRSTLVWQRDEQTTFLKVDGLCYWSSEELGQSSQAWLGWADKGKALTTVCEIWGEEERYPIVWKAIELLVRDSVYLKRKQQAFFKHGRCGWVRWCTLLIPAFIVSFIPTGDTQWDPVSKTTHTTKVW